LSVKPDKDDPEGFVVYSFAGDDWEECREHVRVKLGLAWIRAAPHLHAG
jgi:hypothetical protein